MGKLKVNLCSGAVNIYGYINVDICNLPHINHVLDLEKTLLPFYDNSADVIACNGAIGYFTEERAGEIIKDVYRVLKVGGVTRFGTQDLRVIAEKYIERDRKFYFQILSNGRYRFPGRTFCEKFNEWYYGHHSGHGKHCKYVYDFETLKLLFDEAGFKQIKDMEYLESNIPEVHQLDNRKSQLFFLEAIK